MDELRLRSRTISELVDAAFALYRRDSGQYILIMAVASIPQVVARLLLQPGGALNSAVLIGLVTLVVSAISIALGSATIMKFGSAVYLGEGADLESAVRTVVRKMWSILGAGLLKAILYFIGFLVFFVGEFYVAARFFAVGAVIVLEDRDVGEAFSRSSELSNGRKWHVLFTLALVWIIYFVLSVCGSLVANMTKSTVVAIVLTTAFQIVAYPVIGLTGMVLYYDCRIRGEGYDIERMAASMDRGPGASPGVAGATT